MINTDLYTKASADHEPTQEELTLPDPVDSQEAIFANTVGPSGDFTIFPYVSVLEYNFHECKSLAEKTDVLPAHS